MTAARHILLITVAELGELSGPAIHVLNLANHLARLGHRVTLVSPRPGKSLPIALGAGVTHRPLASRRHPGLPAIALLRQISHVLKTIAPPDAVYIRASVGTWPLLSLVRRRWPDPAAVPVAVEYNAWFSADMAALSYSAPIVRIAERLQIAEAARADVIRVVTSGLGDLLRRHGIDAQKIHVIDNGTDIATYTPLDRSTCRRKHAISENAKVVAFAGNLWPALDFPTVFAALKHLADAGNAIECIIIGDGIQRQAFEAQAQAILGSRAASVRWLGAQPPAVVNEIYNAADVVLAPFTAARNTVTGLAPLKIRDCAGSGRPCVATAIAGITELGREPWMFLAEPGNAESFAAAVRAAFDADPVAVPAAARAYAEAHFDWQSVAEKVAACFHWPATP